MQVDFWDSTRQSAAIFVRLESQKDTSATWTLEWGDPYAKPQKQADVWDSISDTLKWRVRELLTKEQWSPKQIAGRLRKEGHNISHETIYAMIRADDTG